MASAAASAATSSLSKSLLRNSASSRRRPAMPSLSRVLVAPSRVANALEWSTGGSSSSKHGRWSGGSHSLASILTMNLTRDSMELLVASHPLLDEPVQTLPSIPLKTEIILVPDKKEGQDQEEESATKCSHHDHHHHKHKHERRRLVPAVAMEFKQILQDWQVAGVVVNWPVQEEGWCGYACGKVLFVLDHLHSYQCFTSPQKRPVCLWDQVHHDMPYEDEWGRSEQYSIVSTKSVHRASQEQYDVPPGTYTAAGVWDDFCRTHWPECYSYGHPGLRSSSRSSLGSLSYAHRSHTIKQQPWLSTVPTLGLRSGSKNLRDS